MLGALGTLNALTLVYSRLPAVMAEDGFLPRGLVKRTRRTYAPWVSILVCAGAWALCLGLNFSKLVMIDVLLTGLSILLEFAAFVALRMREPDTACGHQGALSSVSVTPSQARRAATCPIATTPSCT